MPHRRVQQANDHDFQCVRAWRKITKALKGKVVGRAYLYVMTNDLHERPFGLMEDVFIDPDHNLERKAPKHVLAEIRDDFHRIVYAANADEAHAAYTAFEPTWAKRCPGVVATLREGGDELLTFFSFPKVQWKTSRTTNTIERLHEEFRRRVKTQGSLPSEEAALILLFSLVVSGQIKLRRIDGGRKIAAVLRQHTSVAA